MKKKIYTALLTIFFFSISFGQSYNIKVYSIDEGIPQSQVHAIIQDKGGFIWLGTDGGGLSRFDGKNVISFTDINGLANNIVFSIALDDKEQMWLGTNKGVSLFKNNSFIKLPDVFKQIEELAVRHVFIDSGKKIWFCTPKGAFIYNGNSLTSVEELKDKNILQVYEDKNKNLWVATIADGCFVIQNDKTVKHYTTDEGLNNNNIGCFVETKKDGILIGTDNGLNRIKDNIISKVPLPSPPNSKVLIRFMAFDKQDNLWIGSLNAGVYKISVKDTVFIGSDEGLGINGVFCFMQDSENNVWIGTDGNGIAKYGRQTFNFFSKKNGMPSDMILSMCKTRKNQWWFGHDNGATFYDGKKYIYYNSENGLINEKVWDITEDHEGNIWISTYGSGIYKFDGRTFINYSEKNGLSSNRVRCIVEDSKKRIWVGTASGLNLFDGKNFTIYTTTEGLSSNRILGVHEDRNHNIWIGTSGGGIMKLSEKNNTLSFTAFTDKEGLADNVVLSIAEDAIGNIWTGNFGGISYIDTKSGIVKKITKKDGLSSNTVYAISFTNGKHLLVGSNNGVDKLDVSEYFKTGKIITQHFGKEEGFLGTECNTNSIFKDVDGRISIGTIKGLFIYNPVEDVISKTEPQTHITGLRLFFENFDYGKYVDITDTTGNIPAHITLPYDQNHLTFDFVGLSFNIPKNVKYKYMIDGFDQHFNEPVSENFATYSNLPPGNYVFKLLASNSDGIWNSKPITFSFSIKPPFWKTWWFRVSAFVFLVVSIAGYFKNRINRLRKVQNFLEEQVYIKTTELREEKELVDEQNKVIEKKNQNITSSIRYAKRIQEAILPIKEKLNDFIPEAFIFFKPKDIVSGDFYWFTKRNNMILLAAVDCTGHGVPGAFMSLIGNNLLNDIVKNQGIYDPAQILCKLHEGLVSALKKSEQESDTVDGMDIILCVLNGKTLEFSSTGRPLFLVRNLPAGQAGNEIKKYKVGKHPLGLITKKEIKFEKENIQLQAGDTFYIFTDGYCDQFGGPEDEKYLDSNFQKFLLKIQGQKMNEQATSIELEIDNWKGKHPQIDDMLVIGIRY